MDFLDEVERAFSVVWPEPFRAFCRIHAGSGPSGKYPALRGTFLCDLEGLERTNALIGEGSWSDYEKAIAGRRSPKDGHTIYMGLLPFYAEKDCVFGFLTTNPGSDKVVVWSVHTFIHDYPTFDAWLADRP
jgi:hypothetical protein